MWIRLFLGGVVVLIRSLFQVSAEGLSAATGFGVGELSVSGRGSSSSSCRFVGFGAEPVSVLIWCRLPSSVQTRFRSRFGADSAGRFTGSFSSRATVDREQRGQRWQALSSGSSGGSEVL